MTKVTGGLSVEKAESAAYKKAVQEYNKAAEFFKDLLSDLYGVTTDINETDGRLALYMEGYKEAKRKNMLSMLLQLDKELKITMRLIATGDNKFGDRKSFKTWSPVNKKWVNDFMEKFKA